MGNALEFEQVYVKIHSHKFMISMCDCFRVDVWNSNIRGKRKMTLKWYLNKQICLIVEERNIISQSKTCLNVWFAFTQGQLKPFYNHTQYMLSFNYCLIHTRFYCKDPLSLIIVAQLIRQQVLAIIITQGIYCNSFLLSQFNPYGSRTAGRRVTVATPSSPKLNARFYFR